MRGRANRDLQGASFRKLIRSEAGREEESGNSVRLVPDLLREVAYCAFCKSTIGNSTEIAGSVAGLVSDEPKRRSPPARPNSRSPNSPFSTSPRASVKVGT